MSLYNGYTPAELLMGKKTTFYTSVGSGEINTKWPETEQLRKVELEYKHKQAKNYNWWHRASVLPALKPGEKVWVTDRSAPAVIVQKSPEPGSYVVKIDQSLLRRNRRQLVETPTPAPKLEKQKRDDLPKCESSNNFTVTCSGRTVIPPKRLELQK